MVCSHMQYGYCNRGIIIVRLCTEISAQEKERKIRRKQRRNRVAQTFQTVDAPCKSRTP